MLSKRIIPCLDVKDGVVVKGVQFRNHEVMGGIVELARRYASEGADELVFYDITASSDERVVDKSWVSRVAEVIDIPSALPAASRAWRMPARSWSSGPTRSPSTRRRWPIPPSSPDWPNASACSVWWWASTPILMRRAVTIRSNSLPATRAAPAPPPGIPWIGCRRRKSVEPVKSC